MSEIRLLVSGATELSGAGNPDWPMAGKPPATISPFSGEVFSRSGTSVSVWPPLSSSVWTIGLDGSPAALPPIGQISPVRAAPPAIAEGDPADALVGASESGEP